ncbi:MAG: hypothetical protein HBSAPP03_06730 [Phycisphaerae bacterium]|nr:MAG: hypothetical protein HBSAPP03_06730 [Phycisphaerae bacterium]
MGDELFEHGAGEALADFAGDVVEGALAVHEREEVLDGGGAVDDAVGDLAGIGEAEHGLALLGLGWEAADVAEFGPLLVLGVGVKGGGFGGLGRWGAGHGEG